MQERSIAPLREANWRVTAPDGSRSYRAANIRCPSPIHMTDIPSFPYADLWGERHILSVANLTREDGTSFLEVAAKANIRPVVTTLPLAQANEAVAQLRKGAIKGAAVLVP